MRSIERISATYAWYQGYGNHVDSQALATYPRCLTRQYLLEAPRAR